MGTWTQPLSYVWVVGFAGNKWTAFSLNVEPPFTAALLRVPLLSREPFLSNGVVEDSAPRSHGSFLPLSQVSAYMSPSQWGLFLPSCLKQPLPSPHSLSPSSLCFAFFLELVIIWDHAVIFLLLLYMVSPSQNVSSERAWLCLLHC